MANNISSLHILFLILLTFLPTIAISSSSHHNHHHHHGNKHGLKYKHYTLYQHDIFNQTDFIIVTGVTGTNFTQVAAPFGTITILKDDLTLTPDPSSKVVGDCEALIVASSFDGLDGLSIVRFALDLEDGVKSTISVLGVVNTL
ncbi:hypothetical protein RND81_08G115400 [Saponaria officinalis]|uniref:Dirigent protein n=1 Tax=Saponaria officinalis TaxID=3572 RepID=A0AAW1J5L8_SAPOF